MEECVVHYNGVSQQKLVKLSSETSWKTLLQAAKRRNFQPILDISSTVKADYHSVQNVARSTFSERFLLNYKQSSGTNLISCG